MRTPLAAPTPYGQQLRTIVDQLEGSERSSPEKFRQYQLGALGQPLAHAYETVPSYRARLGDLGYQTGPAVALDNRSTPSEVDPTDPQRAGPEQARAL